MPRKRRHEVEANAATGPAQQFPSPRSWSTREVVLLGLVCLTVGLLAGYVLHDAAPGATSQTAAGSTAPPSVATAGTSPTVPPAILSQQAAPLLAALNADPKNFETLAHLGNLYYDAKEWSQAIPYYTRALEQRPNEVEVRTDLGTAYYYSGQPGRAVQEYQRSLAINPSHANTLMNLGIVKFEGLGDAPGAIAAWEKFLQTNPNHPERSHVEELLARAKSQR